MRVVVMGLGRFGGGVGATRYLARRGARVLVTDIADEADLRPSIDALGDLDIEYRLGEHVESDLDGVDLLVVSPAVDRRRSAFFQAAEARRVPWTTEINLFLERCPARVIAVTGSVGKSTTCAMLHTIMTSAPAAESGGIRRAFLGGNIGQSLLDSLEEMTAQDVVVLELSSFQLEATPAIEFRPDVAGLANVHAHHLDRYDDFEAYLDAKLNILRFQRPGDTVVVGDINASAHTRVRRIVDRRGSRLVMARPDEERYELQVPGAHNQANAHLAVSLAHEFGISRAVGCKALRAFAGLPHRLEFVGAVDDVRYFNDSKSTSAEAVATALRSFAKPAVVLCGGKDTGPELDRIVDGVWHNVRAVICFGDAGERLNDLFKRHVSDQYGCAVHHAPAMAEAVRRARSVAHRGDVVLLSPGCPSYDEFVNYEDRGQAFVTIVRGWM